MGAGAHSEHGCGTAARWAFQIGAPSAEQALPPRPLGCRGMLCAWLRSQAGTFSASGSGTGVCAGAPLDPLLVLAQELLVVLVLRVQRPVHHLRQTAGFSSRGGSSKASAAVQPMPAGLYSGPAAGETSSQPASWADHQALEQVGHAALHHYPLLSMTARRWLQHSPPGDRSAELIPAQADLRCTSTSTKTEAAQARSTQQPALAELLEGPAQAEHQHTPSL